MVLQLQYLQELRPGGPLAGEMELEVIEEYLQEHSGEEPRAQSRSDGEIIIAGQLKIAVIICYSACQKMNKTII